MKFIVEQSALTDGVNWVSRSLSTRPIKTELLGICSVTTYLYWYIYSLVVFFYMFFDGIDMSPRTIATSSHIALYVAS